MSLFFLLIMTLAQPAEATQILKCKNESGETVYTQNSCPRGYFRADVTTYKIEQPSAKDQQAQQERLKQMAKSVSSNNSNIELERKKESLQKQIRSLEQQRDQMVKDKKALIGSIAGVNATVRSNMIAEEMKTEFAAYEQQILALDKQLNQLTKRAN